MARSCPPEAPIAGATPGRGPAPPPPPAAPTGPMASVALAAAELLPTLRHAGAGLPDRIRELTRLVETAPRTVRGSAAEGDER